ncbi:hypothetical protein CPB86DRAFT_787319 [Serendipita vermifera]|nr:hypothetical protein CPB86DRAFT_787319 [Serendipita vermifera]
MKCLFRVAVYAYGQFDDDVEPIYTLQVDDDDPVRLGEVSQNPDQMCDPLYAKLDLEMGEHTIKLTLTNERPDDVRDLAFNGFIVTVPDIGDDVSSLVHGSSSQTGAVTTTSGSYHSTQTPTSGSGHRSVPSWVCSALFGVAIFIASVL